MVPVSEHSAFADVPHIKLERAKNFAQLEHKQIQLRGQRTHNKAFLPGLVLFRRYLAQQNGATEEEKLLVAFRRRQLAGYVSNRMCHWLAEGAEFHDRGSSAFFRHRAQFSKPFLTLRGRSKTGAVGATRGAPSLGRPRYLSMHREGRARSSWLSTRILMAGLIVAYAGPLCLVIICFVIRDDQLRHRKGEHALAAGCLKRACSS